LKMIATVILQDVTDVASWINTHRLVHYLNACIVG